MFRNAAAEFVYIRTYARWIEQLLRRETWPETVDRVIEFLTSQRGNKIPPKVLRKIKERMLAFEVMPSMRLVWAAGEAAKADNTSIYNCLGKSTEFITSEGVKSFNDFSEGDITEVLTHKGVWKSAVVKSYGIQTLNEVYFNKGKRGLPHKVEATENHRWLLKNGEITVNLKEGDVVLMSPNIAEEFSYDTADPLEKLYWSYGYVYGNGTKVKGAEGNYKYSMVRLYGKDANYEKRFKELWFKTSSSASLNGDVMAYTDTYLKTLPDFKKDSPKLIRAFITGLLDAAGGKSYNNKTKQYINIQASGQETVDFLRKALPVAGHYIIREDDFSGQETNLGVRKTPTVRFSINCNKNVNSNSVWKVSKITKNVKNIKRLTLPLYFVILTSRQKYFNSFSTSAPDRHF